MRGQWIGLSRRQLCTSHREGSKQDGMLRFLACPQVWSGSVTGIAHKSLAVVADYLAGPADIAQLLGQQDVRSPDPSPSCEMKASPQYGSTCCHSACRSACRENQIHRKLHFRAITIRRAARPLVLWTCCEKHAATPQDVSRTRGCVQVHVKGRMPFERVEKFCEELRHSRRRTCSVAIVR